MFAAVAILLLVGAGLGALIGFFLKVTITGLIIGAGIGLLSGLFVGMRRVA